MVPGYIKTIWGYSPVVRPTTTKKLTTIKTITDKPQTTSGRRAEKKSPARRGEEPSPLGIQPDGGKYPRASELGGACDEEVQDVDAAGLKRFAADVIEAWKPYDGPGGRSYPKEQSHQTGRESEVSRDAPNGSAIAEHESIRGEEDSQIANASRRHKDRSGSRIRSEVRDPNYDQYRKCYLTEP
jgi:hypothetical protein